MDELVDNKNMRKNRLIEIFDDAKIVEFSDQTDQNRRQIVTENCTDRNKCRPSVNIVIITIFITIPFILFVIMILFYHFVQYE
uniref:Uncharacterized protein n=1 Tax=Globodera rostochiensis TaxID=31243 RepID=A0A914IB70_GLORO